MRITDMACKVAEKARRGGGRSQLSGDRSSTHCAERARCGRRGPGGTGTVIVGVYK